MRAGWVAGFPLVLSAGASALTAAVAFASGPSIGRAPRLSALSGPAAPRGETQCQGCHTETSWADARFDHDRALFPLAGAHGKLACRACHTRDFSRRISDTCAGCHRDRHAGQVGAHCEGCHDERSWRETSFGVGAHTATSFPLVGKHAAIPCEECHGNMRERSFARAPLACVDCHRADVAAAASRSIDHAAARFGDACQECHTTWSFFPARFRAHDACFNVSSGAHRALRCQQCHANPSALTLTGLCAAQDVQCVSCHAHGCDVSSRQHQSVMGYECQDQKCFQCHRSR